MKIRNTRSGKFAERTHPIKWSEAGFNFDSDETRTFNKDSVLRWLRIEAEAFQFKMCKLSWRFLEPLFADMEFVDNEKIIPAANYFQSVFPDWF